MHAAFVERVREQNLVPVYDNISYKIEDIEPDDETFADDMRPLDSRQWREEIQNYRKKGEILREDMYYWGPPMVQDADLLVYDHAFQDDGERIETQLQLLKMFVKLWENPLLLMRVWEKHPVLAQEWRLLSKHS